MSSAATKTSLDLSIAGLFPGKREADKDEKCRIIAQLLNEMVRARSLREMTQGALQSKAKEFYEDLSQKSKLTLLEADRRGFLLYQQGVGKETAKKYYSLRLREADVKRWS